ncbi:uncharacterized protein HD556DRAFT_1316949 [Suillus plorans]|uniref:Secreted protein n=1 Tax=Suillus plorans TaxID=116603 RepID=A0A9P7J9R0_9AGAM|nr:uncharacterized protein HD556DRAFT_1316949 [Suillus plorans]KAG1809959.1 hypothetical protein HD556DRAFT_1316949 [Suillus plorans]
MMRLSFVLAVVAAFKLSVSVPPPSIDIPCPILCNTTADCGLVGRYLLYLWDIGPAGITVTVGRVSAFALVYTVWLTPRRVKQFLSTSLLSAQSSR